MAENIDIEVKGTELYLTGLRGIQRRLSEDSRDVIAKAAHAGWEAMQATVPRDEGVLADHIQVSEPRYHPGGAGGGGFWEAHAFVEDFRRSAASRTPRTMLEMITEGTGLHGPFHSMIVAKSGRRFVWAGRNGNLVFRRAHRGMEAQTDWIEAGQEAAANEAQKGVFAMTDRADLDPRGLIGHGPDRPSGLGLIG